MLRSQFRRSLALRNNLMLFPLLPLPLLLPLLLLMMMMTMMTSLPANLIYRRMYSLLDLNEESTMGEYETKIYNILNEEFKPLRLQVQDVSGGCGSMFAILVESAKFKGLPMIKQHRLVNETLKDEIKKWHGLQLKTKST